MNTYRILNSALILSNPYEAVKSIMIYFCMMERVPVTLLDLLEGNMSFGSVNSIPQVFIKHLSEQSTMEPSMYKQLKFNWFREYLLHHFTLKRVNCYHILS